MAMNLFGLLVSMQQTLQQPLEGTSSGNSATTGGGLFREAMEQVVDGNSLREHSRPWMRPRASAEGDPEAVHSDQPSLVFAAIEALILLPQVASAPSNDSMEEAGEAEPVAIAETRVEETRDTSGSDRAISVQQNQSSSQEFGPLDSIVGTSLPPSHSVTDESQLPPISSHAPLEPIELLPVESLTAAGALTRSARSSPSIVPFDPSDTLRPLDPTDNLVPATTALEPKQDELQIFSLHKLADYRSSGGNQATEPLSASPTRTGQNPNSVLISSRLAFPNGWAESNATSPGTPQGPQLPETPMLVRNSDETGTGELQGQSYDLSIQERSPVRGGSVSVRVADEEDSSNTFLRESVSSSNTTVAAREPELVADATVESPATQTRNLDDSKPTMVASESSSQTSNTPDADGEGEATANAMRSVQNSLEGITGDLIPANSSVVSRDTPVDFGRGQQEDCNPDTESGGETESRLPSPTLQPASNRIATEPNVGPLHHVAEDRLEHTAGYPAASTSAEGLSLRPHPSDSAQMSSPLNTSPVADSSPAHSDPIVLALTSSPQVASHVPGTYPSSLGSGNSGSTPGHVAPHNFIGLGEDASTISGTGHAVQAEQYPQRSSEFTMRVQFRSDALGLVSLHAVDREGVLEATIGVADPKTHELFSKELPVLHTALSKQDVVLDNIRVVQESASGQMGFSSESQSDTTGYSHSPQPRPMICREETEEPAPIYPTNAWNGVGTTGRLNVRA
jgi:hypothetical protein